MKSFLLTYPCIIGVNTLCTQPTIKSFDDLNKESHREKKKGKKEKKRKRKTKRKPKRKRKGKERKGRGSGRQPRERRERDHGSKEKEEKSPASHPGQPRAAVAAAVVGNAVSRQNRSFCRCFEPSLKNVFMK